MTAVPDTYDEAADATGSYYAAIAAIIERVKAGEPLPESGYFAVKAAETAGAEDRRA
jgi:hypothetical protein